MDKKELYDLLTKIEKEGILNLYSKGYTWVKSNFLPYLELGDTLLTDEGELLADCWYLMGDIHDFNNAPLKAIECYKKAIECDAEIEGAYREIAHMYELIGRYTEALEYINIALEKVPDDEMMMDDKAAIQDSINYSTEPYLTENNQAWKWCEQLAQDDFEAVIKAVTAMENPEVTALLCLARAYGAKENLKKYREVWEQIAATKQHFELEYADWFYMPSSIYEGAEIWQLFKKISPQIDEADFVYFDSFVDNYESQLSDNQRLNVIFDFQIYKATANYEAIKALRKQYPLWQELIF